MSADEVAVELDREPADYGPGDMLAGAWGVAADIGRELRAAEVSVLWYTEGKGDEDLGVHHFERRTAEQGSVPAAGERARFEVRLPRSPLSYDGIIVKVCWCVRVRVFWEGGEAVGEASFRLGDVAPAQEVTPASESS